MLRRMCTVPTLEIVALVGCLALPNLLEEVRRPVASVDPSLPVFRVKTLVAQTEQSLTRERLLATISSFLGALALLPACVGLSRAARFGWTPWRL